MKSCRHCGQANQDDAALCTECGLDLGPSLVQRMTTKGGMLDGHFFRWGAVSVCLYAVALVFGILTPISITLSAHTSVHKWAPISNLIVLSICLGGRYLMSRQRSSYLVAGSCAVFVALLIVMRTWLSAHPFPWVEASLIGLPMLYAIIYGLRESALKDAG